MASLARRTASLTRLSISTPNLIHRRTFAASADHHGPAKVNCWSDPMSPSRWKEEHFVLVSLSGWGLLLYGGFKYSSGGKAKEEQKLVAAPQ